MSAIIYYKLRLDPAARQIRILRLMPRGVEVVEQEQLRSTPEKQPHESTSEDQPQSNSEDQPQSNSESKDQPSSNFEDKIVRISCNLEVTALDLGVPYIALSYTWGDEKDKLPILVNNERILVTRNLENALEQLRDESNELNLWVDAVCINQQDDDEKSHQIQLMRDIYQKASGVSAWIGNSTPLSDQGMNFMTDIGKAAAEAGILKLRPADFEHWNDPTNYPIVRSIKDFVTTMTKYLDINIPTSSLNDVYNREIFSCLWIVQEFSLATELTLICGKKKLPITYFAAINSFFALWLNSIEDMDQPEEKKLSLRAMGANFQFVVATKMVQNRRRYRSESGTPESLLQLLVRSHAVYSHPTGLHVTNPADRIYALLGMATDAQQLNIIPNYKKPYLQIYTDAAVALLTHGNVDVLVLSQHRGDFNEERPSWVPDWSSKIQQPCGGYDSDKLYSATGNSAPQIRFTLDIKPILHISGYKVATIRKTGAHWVPGLSNWRFDWDASEWYFRDIKSYCLASPRYRDNPTDAMMRIPLGDISHTSFGGDAVRAKQPEDDENILKGFEFVQDGRENILKYVEEFKRNPRLGAYQIGMGNQFARRPFLADDGWVGLAPSMAEVGDVVVMFLGVRVPFVISEYSSEHGARGWRLVGEAYVHGAMDGQTMSMGLAPETFDLY
jgi:Heterokaryon incompatibility protein (HET)